MEFNSETAAAFARLIVSLAAGVASTFGWSLDWDMWVNIVISIIAVALFAYTWWRNNNITEAAQEAQLLLEEIKLNQHIDATVGGTDYDE